MPSFLEERLRYADRATEFPVTRLTSPKFASLLAAPGHRVISRRGTFLIYASHRGGAPQLVQLMLATGEARPLTETAALDPLSPALAPDDRSVFYFDGPALKRFVFAGQRETEVYRVPEGWTRGRGFAMAADGARACLVETRDGRWRVRLAPLAPHAEPATAFEADAPLSDPLPRPRHDEILCRDSENFLALSGRRLPLAPGRAGTAFWAGDGESLLYLNFPEGGGQNTVREWVAASASDRLVTPTSQYAAFAPNANASIFVGASASKASPYILLALRITHRELALCEHGSSDAAAVAPFFSPDSQRVFFESDRDGKPAIYMMDVERLVERTEA